MVAKFGLRVDLFVHPGVQKKTSVVIPGCVCPDGMVDNEQDGECTNKEQYCSHGCIHATWRTASMCFDDCRRDILGEAIIMSCHTIPWETRCFCNTGFCRQERGSNCTQISV